MQQGALQQAAMQQLIDAGKGQFQGFANQPQNAQHDVTNDHCATITFRTGYIVQLRVY